jgi:hypothetical protein
VSDTQFPLCSAVHSLPENHAVCSESEARKLCQVITLQRREENMLQAVVNPALAVENMPGKLGYPHL